MREKRGFSKSGLKVAKKKDLLYPRKASIDPFHAQRNDWNDCFNYAFKQTREKLVLDALEKLVCGTDEIKKIEDFDSILPKKTFWISASVHRSAQLIKSEYLQEENSKIHLSLLYHKYICQKSEKSIPLRSFIN